MGREEDKRHLDRGRNERKGERGENIERKERWRENEAEGFVWVTEELET